MTMHLNRVSRKPVKPRSGHTNIQVVGDKYFIRIGSIDYPRRYTKGELSEAVIFRDEMRERLGYPKADY